MFDFGGCPNVISYRPTKPSKGFHFLLCPFDARKFNDHGSKRVSRNSPFGIHVTMDRGPKILHQSSDTIFSEPPQQTSHLKQNTIRDRKIEKNSKKEKKKNRKNRSKQQHSNNRPVHSPFGFRLCMVNLTVAQLGHVRKTRLSWKMKEKSDC